MDYFLVSSVEELKKYGKCREIAKSIRQDFGAIIQQEFSNDIKIRGNTWENLYKDICTLKKLLNSIITTNQSESTQSDNLYFKGDAEKYIFFLLELDGKEHSNKLEINKLHFLDKGVATKWRNDIAKIIHPDTCRHIRAQQATAKLNELYNGMTK